MKQHFLDNIKASIEKMVFEGKIEVNVERQKVWEFLLDINKFASCMPGLDKVTEVDERSFDGVISATVGPISGIFTFRSTILEYTPPREIVVQTIGTDSVTKSKVRVDVTGSLTQPDEKKTELNYHAEVKIEGRLAILGDMVMRATAALILGEFSRRFRDKIEGIDKT